MSNPQAKDYFMVRRGFVYFLFALILVLVIVCAVLSGILAHNRAGTSDPDAGIKSDLTTEAPSASNTNSAAPAGQSGVQPGASSTAPTGTAVTPPTSTPAASGSAANTGAGSAFVPSDTYIVSTDGDALNIRSSPSLEGNIVGEIPKGTHISLIRTEGDWGFLTYNGMTGWVSMQYLTIAPATSE